MIKFAHFVLKDYIKRKTKMGEDLQRVNELFKDLIEKTKKKNKIDRNTERLCYYFFLTGINLNSGMTQLVA